MEVVWLHSLEPLGLECPYPSPSERAQYHPWPSEPIDKPLAPTRPFSSKTCFYMFTFRSISPDLYFPVNRFQKVFCGKGQQPTHRGLILATACFCMA